MFDLFLGFALSLFIAVTAYQRQKLDRLAAFTAVILGTTVVATGGWLVAGMMIWFFLSSTIVGSMAKQSKPERTMWQVLATGGIPTVISLWYWLNPLDDFIVIYASALAVATADTWASELGRLSRKQPLLLFTGERVDAGSDGAVSGLGTIASLIGAASVSLFVGGSLVVIISGFGGSLVDSLLGTVQHKTKWLTNPSVNFFSQLLVTSGLILWFLGSW